MESPRAAEVRAFHEAQADGMGYDVMANEVVDPATGERTSLKTIAEREAEAVR